MDVFELVPFPKISGRSGDFDPSTIPGADDCVMRISVMAVVDKTGVQ